MKAAALVVVLLALVKLYQIGSSAPAPAVAAQEARSAAVASQGIPWSVALARRLGNSAPSPAIVRFIDAWIQAEGTAALNNPLATSQPMPGSTVFNADGVQNYATVEDGLEAAVLTLQQGYAGYADIREGIRTNDVQRAYNGLVASPWGTSAALVAHIYNGTTTTHKHGVTATMQIGANFYSTGDVWCFQSSVCQHLGVDVLGSDGDPVFAPFDGICTSTGAYTDPPRLGEYVTFTTADGDEVYLGHLQRASCPSGSNIGAGTVVGYIRGDLAHTHWQMRDASGGLIDPLAYYNTH